MAAQFSFAFLEFCWGTKRYASPFNFGRKSSTHLSYFKFSRLINVFLFQFRVLRCRAFQCFFFFSFFPFSQVKNTWENFRLDFLRKKGKRGAWFIINLMQNVYKFILLFSKTPLFLMMVLLVRICGRCHLHLRMDVFMFWITGLIWRPLKIKSLTTIFKLSGYFSAECTRSREEQ